MHSTTAFFRLRNISKVYRAAGVATTAIADFSMDMREGEFVAVMGPSGCGKTTLLHIVAMLDAPSSGRYTLGEMDVTAASETQLSAVRKGNVGFIFQNCNLIAELSVYENVELPLLSIGIPWRARRIRVREVLELLDLQHRANHLPIHLSGGQQQRVAVARAVVGEPRLIVSDEPTGNLDSHNGEMVMDMLRTFNQQGTTVLTVTHSATHAGYASRLIQMVDGRLLSDEYRAAAA